MYLIFDTETTGFPSKDLPPSHPAQARVCSLAAVLLDEQFNEMQVLNTLIKPDGWNISEGATKVHGLTNEICEADGISRGDALFALGTLIDHASHLVAHNKKFDDQMLGIEFALVDTEYESNPKYCTMELTTPILKLPQIRKNSFGRQYKWPKLEEAFKYFYPNEPMFNAHDALSDVRATGKVFKALVEKDIVKFEPITII